MTILVDADGVLENLTSEIITFINEKHGTNVRFEEMRDWGFSKIFPELTHEQIVSVECEEELYDRIKPISGAPECLQKLIDEGNKIYIVTNTPYEAIYFKMKKVMERYFPFLTWNNYIITSNKQMIKGDVLIDDGIHNLVNGDYRKILFDAPYNRDYDAEANGMIRVTNWEEVYNVIKKMSSCIEKIK